MKKLAVLISFSGEGGVERMVVNLVSEFARQPDLSVDLVLLRDDSRHLRDLPESVRIMRLGVRHSGLSLPALVRYMLSAQPDAMLVAKDRAGRAALVARMIANQRFPIVMRLGTTLSEAMLDKPGWQRAIRYMPIRWLYPKAEGIVAVSQGVADDITDISGIDRARIHVIRNPVITQGFFERSVADPVHPWLSEAAATREIPVILGMGRLTRQKDFVTMLQAFVLVRKQRQARLIILGDGADKGALLGMAASEGISDSVDLPGFQSNPYPWLARANLFVLSSRWEGSPNALTEAMALGIPVVSTDCRSGPREILDGGRVAPLVPVGDVPALADAMIRTLDSPQASDELKVAVEDYRSEVSARRYLDVLGL